MGDKKKIFSKSNAKGVADKSTQHNLAKKSQELHSTIQNVETSLNILPIVQKRSDNHWGSKQHYNKAQTPWNNKKVFNNKKQQNQRWGFRRFDPINTNKPIIASHKLTWSRWNNKNMKHALYAKKQVWLSRKRIKSRAYRAVKWTSQAQVRRLQWFEKKQTEISNRVFVKQREGQSPKKISALLSWEDKKKASQITNARVWPISAVHEPSASFDKQLHKRRHISWFSKVQHWTKKPHIFQMKKRRWAVEYSRIFAAHRHLGLMTSVWKLRQKTMARTFIKGCFRSFFKKTCLGFINKKQPFLFAKQGLAGVGNTSFAYTQQWFKHVWQKSKLGGLKQRLSVVDKIYYYYQYRFFFSLYTYKILSYLEMFLSSNLLNSRLVRYSFLISFLCFNRLVLVNYQTKNTPFLLISLYDTVSLYNKMAYYVQYTQSQHNFFSTELLVFFNTYWKQYTTLTATKIWLLQNYIKNDIPENLIYSFPNLLLYTTPFRRISNLLYHNTTFDDFFQYKVYKLKRNKWKKKKNFFQRKNLNTSRALFKTKIFEYACFYK